MEKALRTLVAIIVLALAACATPETSQDESPGLRTGDVFRDCPECPEMVVIPAGEFLMGSPNHEQNRSHYEGPVHPVTVYQPFAIGKFEVTFAEWDACLADGGCGDYQPSDMGWGRGDRPVINISFEDAKAYVAWLNKKTGQSYRLPSEAEWEYAARAGTTTPYHFGETISTDEANFGSIGFQRDPTKKEFLDRTAPVGSYPPNKFGLHDVLGNVEEWVEDCRSLNYAFATSVTQPRTSGECRFRMVRGGSWNYPQGRARSAYRGWLNTGKGNGKDGNGFRVARSLPSSETDYVAIPLGQQVHALLAGFEAYDSGDYEAAVLEWQALANKGHAVAQFNLGVMYQLGLGVGQDNAEAVNWYRMAAEQGNAKAQQNIGYMYMKGLGLAQSSTQALKWYREAANQGNAATQYLLGSLYAGDPDGQQDYVLAYMWLNLASRQGYEGAADARTAVASNMTDEQLSEARKLVLNWEPK